MELSVACILSFFYRRRILKGRKKVGKKSDLSFFDVHIFSFSPITLKALSKNFIVKNLYDYLV